MGVMGARSPPSNPTDPMKAQSTGNTGRDQGRGAQEKAKTQAAPSRTQKPNPNQLSIEEAMKLGR